ncbi:MAG: class I SAM-dependent methyltransferase [Candidatus Binataceae bacterium]
MSQVKIGEPDVWTCGRIPTLNQRGFTTELPDPLSQRFIEFAAEIDSEVLDIGCAYGVAVKRVLSAGGQICACDMDQRHLDILVDSVKPADRTRLRCVAGILPDVDFEECAFGAILCSRVLHFLEGSDVELSVSKMHRWLRPGGKLFLIVDTPYSGVASDRIVPEYERKKALKDPWPGFIPEYDKYLPANSRVRFATSFIHLMDPDTLSRVCEQAGLAVESKGFMARIANLSVADPKGRDHATVVAVKA